jgi:hypothetical protein
LTITPLSLTSDGISLRFIPVSDGIAATLIMITWWAFWLLRERYESR